MSRATFLVGLVAGAESVDVGSPTPCLRGDPDYERGYLLGALDVRARLALYDREHAAREPINFAAEDWP